MTVKEDNIYFFKCYSNIGIQNIPNHQSARNDGVYFGSDSVLNSDFVAKFPNAYIHEFRFSDVREINNDIFQIFASESASLTSLAVESLNPADTAVFVGGDNSICFSAVLSAIERFKEKKIGIIDFDTHGDIHLHATSPTENIHGMYLRPFFDNFDIEVIDKLVPKKLTQDDLIYFGNFDLEKEERDFLNEKEIPLLTGEDIRGENDSVITTLKNFLTSHDHVVINFDIDVFDSSIVTATGITNDNGLLESDVFPLLRLIKSHKSKTIVISELNPEKVGAEESSIIARSVIQELTGD